MPILAGILTTVAAATGGAAIIHLAILIFGQVGPEVLDEFAGAFLLSVLFGLPIAGPTTLLILPILSLVDEEGLIPAAGAIGGFVSVAALVVAFISKPDLSVLAPLAAIAALGSLVGWWSGQFYESALKRLRAGAALR